MGRAGKGATLGGGALLLVLVVALLTGEDPGTLVEVIDQQGGSATPAPPPNPRGGNYDEEADFVAVVLADTEDTWNTVFQQRGQRYRPPVLTMFTGAVESACGFNSAAVGPFYCPADQKVYIDLSFFSDLRRRFGAPGDFAQAYVIAHEVGHHVQNLLGISQEVRRLRSRLGQVESNALSVRVELQADCLAGVWGYHADRYRNLLEQGDIEEGLRAAAAIGDDRLQSRSSGYVNPESWTHGSSEQRMEWFSRGLREGRVEVCNTFEDRR